MFGFEKIEIFLALLAVLALVWMGSYGVKRGLLATLLRGAWLGCIISIFFPDTTVTKIPSKTSLKKISVLVDDSNSMKRRQGLTTYLESAESYVDMFKSECEQVGCSISVTKLSDVASETLEDKTPLLDSASTFIQGTSGEPWAIISDGGDKHPYKSNYFSNSIDIKKEAPGIVLGVGLKPNPNVWMSDLDVPSFGFAGKPTEISVMVNRDSARKVTSNIQIQADLDGESVQYINVKFRKDETSKLVNMTLPPTEKGHHLISVKSIRVDGEELNWDNLQSAHIEIVPNTIGILHISGSPSADTRYLRRFVKSEPKFDLISFFILRDPWDSQFVSEREMSLIPFPVERLFTQELANFKLVIIQNFRMMQFLNSRYQKNLVEFVKNGGGLLFLGGPRGFNEADLAGQYLKSILPFEVKPKSKAKSKSGMRYGFGGGGTNNDKPSDINPWYDNNLSFEISMAEVTPDKRELASVYEDIAALSSELSSVKSLSGLHHMENVTFSKDGYTNLLSAKSKSGDFPLVSASYPGKGRAIWVFTDETWKIASSTNVSRDTYNKFYQGILNWLVRDDTRKPISVQSFDVQVDGGSTHYRVGLSGPAIRYFKKGKDWKLNVCGKFIYPADYITNKSSELDVSIQGVFKNVTLDGNICQLELKASHVSFGEETVESLTFINKTFTDTELPYSETVLKRLAGKHGAIYQNDQSGNLKTSISKFVQTHVNGDGIQLPPKELISTAPFWFLDTWMYLLALLALPLEVVVRRWDQIYHTA
jgi:hypothetical protein